MKRSRYFSRAKKVWVLVLALMMLTGVFAASAAETDPLKPADVISADGNITLHKQAERIGPDEWEVTVSANVNQMEVEPPKLEVVFVLDCSISMLACADEELHAMPYGIHYHDSSCPIGDSCSASFVNHRNNNFCYIWDKNNNNAQVKFTPNRYEVAISAINSLTSSLPDGTNIKRVAFSIPAYTDSVSSFDPNFTEFGTNTYLMTGVNKGVEQFSNDDATKIMVILTDGEATHDVNGGKASLYSTPEFTAFDGMVFTVGFNHHDANLAAMAKNDGAYYHAGNPGELTSAFNQISTKITAMLVDPMGPKVNFDITDTTPSSGNLVTSGDTIYWTPDDDQELTGEVVKYSYKVKLNDSADHSVGTHPDIALNNPTSFRYGVETGGVTEMKSMNFPIPHAEYAYSSMQVNWVDENGTALTVDGYTPTEEECVICDYAGDNYTPAYTTDYQTITEKIEVPGGNGAYYQYVNSTYTADGAALAGVEDVNAENAVAHVVTHHYVLVEPGELALIGEKYLYGRSFQEGDEFEFRVQADKGNYPMPPEASGVELRVTVDPTTGQNIEPINFGIITYTKTGVFEYEVFETHPSQNHMRVDADDTHYTLVVTVTENADKTLKVDYTITNNATGEQVDKIIFTNTYPTTGDLILNKTVKGSASATENFVFRITTENEVFRSDMEKWVGKNPGAAIFENGAVVVRTGDITITDGMGQWSQTLSKFPTGTYTVTEDAAGNYETSYQVNNAVASQSPADIEVLEDGTVTVSVLNEVPQGSLKLVKVIEGASEDADLAKISFTVTGPDGYSKIVTYAEFTNGEYLLENLPVGAYKVTEDESTAQVPGYTLTVTGNNAEADVTKDKTATVTITNTYVQDV
ncbi:MAG: hypothetical protein IJN44_04385, partial [Clostridia bacterium]|nr:hypothetical protein [Clostridia bacterium]